MRIEQVVTEYGAEDQSWLGSKHATDTARTVTLDASAFSDFEGGIVPSGVVIGPTGENGLYAPVASGTAGEGHIFTTTNVNGGGNVPAAMLWHGSVIVANLPENSGLTADTAVPAVTYVGELEGGDNGGGGGGTED